MAELEENLLHKLNSTEGSLVDDESLIEVLRITKITSKDVQDKLVGRARDELVPGVDVRLEESEVRTRLEESEARARLEESEVRARLEEMG